MANISIKDVPDAWAEALRQRAARNHRSLQGELMAIIEAALVNAVPMVPAPTPGSQDVVVGY
ncbi:MAG: Arc family DNA-binding protein, partial [Comamonadaceae bacterium]